jgi:uncharacterized phage-associated protein
MPHLLSKKVADVAPAVDVAEYILRKCGEMDAYKLEKLTFYSQAWSLAWGHGPIFPDKIEAWQRGPVIRSLFQRHAGKYLVASVGGDVRSVEASARDRATIDAVIKFYFPMSGTQLSDLTHVEDPWVNARSGLAPNERGTAEITQEAIKKYYDGLASRAAS